MVSVCIATYNGSKYIREQILSILSQLSDQDEIIISDDCSTDNTISIIQQFNDNRIKIYHHTPSMGSSFYKAKSNFENALSHASGDYIFLADQDDIWLPNKIKVMIPYLKQYGCVQHGKTELNEDTKTYYQSPPLKQHNVFSGVLSMHFAGCCMGLSKEYLHKALPIPEKVLTHDGWLACYAISLNTYRFIEDCLISHRIHDKNVSTNTNNSLIFRFKYRIRIIIEIIKRNVKR